MSRWLKSNTNKFWILHLSALFIPGFTEDQAKQGITQYDSTAKHSTTILPGYHPT